MTKLHRLKEARRKIKALTKRRDKIYDRVLKDLKLVDCDLLFDYMYNNGQSTAKNALAHCKMLKRGR